MLTIDERTASLMQALDGGAGPAVFQRQLRTAMQEVARDQRELCADALVHIPCKPDLGYVAWRDAHAAVMAAEMK